jgi:hypothetical protein
VRTRIVGVFTTAVVLTAGLLGGAPAGAAQQFSVSNSNDSGSGSLRQAMLDANRTPGSDTIVFSIGSGRVLIAPTSPLPVLTETVRIDGTTQPGFAGTPIIEISGHGVGGGPGIRVTNRGAGSELRGLSITRFPAQGIFVDASNVAIVGNFVGLDPGGNAAGNGDDGVAVFSGIASAPATGNRVGGVGPAERNVISANRGNGVGVTAQDGGVADGTIVSGNFIGTDTTGTLARGNRGDGVLLNNARGQGSIRAAQIGGSTDTTPAGSCTGVCNLISGNIANGVGLWHTGVTATAVQGNFIGTDVSGSAAVRNGDIGVEINEAPNNVVGGTAPSARNVLSGNAGAGVFLTGSAATGNTVSGNLIGTDSTGLRALGNLKMGVGIGASPGAVGARDSTIGGATGGPGCTGACNVISGNGENGILVVGAESSGHVIAGNTIGLGVDRVTPIPNSVDGVGVLDARGIRIGGSQGIEGNTIAANRSNGIIIVGADEMNVVIGRNRIGLDTAGKAAGNGGAGVSVVGARQVAILANSMSSNGGLGIDLNGNGMPTINDPGDVDQGANGSQNFPSVFSATTRNGQTSIGGQFSGEPLKQIRVEFFESRGCNAAAPRDYGEGVNFIGSIDISTDRFGNTAWGFRANIAVPGNHYITATATALTSGRAGETSEFSQCVLVNAAKPALTNGATWFLKRGLTTGPADLTFGYGFPTYFMLCAWDPVQPGVKLPVIYAGGTWLMRASYTTGVADLMVRYGGSQRPVCGDWDGDGVDTIGVVGLDGTFLLRNSNTAGPPDAGTFPLPGGPGIPIVGDWDGDGRDGVGFSDGARWKLTDLTTDAAMREFSWGPGGAPVVGDWDGDGIDTIGFVSRSGTWTIRNTAGPGGVDGVFQFGFTGATPLVW